MKKTKLLTLVLPLIAAGFVLFAGCESPMNPAGDPPDPGPGPTPALPLTADVGYVETTCALSFDMDRWAGAGTAAETWYVGGAISPAAYFGAEKTAAQTITVGGTDGARVTKAAPGQSVDGYAAGPQLDLFTLDTSGMMFGGTLEFTLTVGEAGKKSKTVTVRLAVEASAPAGLYQGDTRIDAADSAAGDNVVAKALAWLGSNAVNEAEYTIILGEDISLAPVVLNSANLNSTTSIGITLLGTGGERAITLAENGTLFDIKDAHILRVGSNTTLRGKAGVASGNLVNVTGTWSPTRYEALFELLDGGKLTGYDRKQSSYAFVVNVGTGAFAMKGGTITGNDTTTIVNVGGTIASFTMTGGSITGNTALESVVRVTSTSTTPTHISGGEIRGNTIVSNLWFEADIYVEKDVKRFFLSGNPRIGRIALVSGRDNTSSINIGAEGFSGSVDAVDLQVESANSFTFDEKIYGYWARDNQVPVLKRGEGFTGPFPVSRFPLNQFRYQKSPYDTQAINPGQYHIDAATGCLVGVPTVESIVVNPDSGTVYRGGVQYFDTLITGKNGNSQALTWEITSPHAAGTGFDASGKLTIAAGETASTLTLKATSAQNPAITKTITVDVGASAPARGQGLYRGDSAIPVDLSGERTLNILLDMHSYFKRHLRSNTEYILLLGEDVSLAPVSNKGLCLMQTPAPPGYPDPLPNDAAGMNTNGSTGVTITLRGLGAERTISLSARGYFARIGAGITLVLDENITVQGNTTNTSNSLLWVDGGVLEVREGSKLTGHVMTSNQGVGVRVNAGGTLRMTGGEISGNTGTVGAGVAVLPGGTFVMTGGSITGNAAGTSETTGKFGGGVYVEGQNSRVSISGGTISGNGGLGDLYLFSTLNVAAPTLTLSGSPVIGSLGLCASNAVYYSSVTIGAGGFNPASPLTLHLNVSNNSTSIEQEHIDWWVGKPVLKQGEGFSGSFPVGKFTLGNFYNNKSPERVVAAIGSRHIDAATGNLVND